MGVTPWLVGLLRMFVYPPLLRKVNQNRPNGKSILLDWFSFVIFDFYLKCFSVLFSLLRDIGMKFDILCKLRGFIICTTLIKITCVTKIPNLKPGSTSLRNRFLFIFLIDFRKRKQYFFKKTWFTNCKPLHILKTVFLIYATVNLINFNSIYKIQ